MEALAQALGITLDELQSAYEQAFKAAIAQAVDEGLLTEEQAERLSDLDHFGMRGMRGPGGFGGDMNAFLAEALGISEAELEDAQQKARTTLLDQAVEQGTMSQEEAELIETRNALQPYLEEAMSNAFESALQEAVADGVISQDQADRLLENREAGLYGFGGKGFFGGFGMGGRGGLPGKSRNP
jgi:polyhydroxyalkanoate synthesis regulator phasin